MKNNSKILSGIILPFALLSSMLVPANSAISLEENSPPNDPLYYQQWNLEQLKIPSLWKRATGEGQIVSVIDTGIVEHPDLDRNRLRGYDMISDDDTAMDTQEGRDDNPTDEGTHCTTGEKVVDSNWHGTHVAGIIAAVANNNIGIAGVAPDAKILPVRVIGKCGGLGPDGQRNIADAILWSIGSEVDGVPTNLTPATVINISIHSDPEIGFDINWFGSCPPEVQSAIDQAVAKNIPVVTISGNYSRDSASSRPGNCNNVINVAASNYSKYITPYSNRGPEVDTVAPGGYLPPDGYVPPRGYEMPDNDVYKYPKIISTTNSGKTKPEYSQNEGHYASVHGTSQAAPYVAGVIAMIRSTNPDISPATIEQLLKDTGTPIASCHLICGSLINPVAAVEKAQPLVIITPNVSVAGHQPDGYPRIWDTLTASPDQAWYPATTALTYQWRKSGIDIPDATSRTYTVQPSDLGATLSVKVTGANQGYKSTSVISKETLKVSYGDKISPPSTPPYIEGTLASGNTLEAKLNGSWGPSPVDVTYQWYRGGEDGLDPEIMIPLTGANKSTYALTAQDEGKVIEVVITGNKYGYVPNNVKARTKTFIATKDRIVSSGPVIEGIYEVGETLTVKNSDLTPTNAHLYYQWRAIDAEDGREGYYLNMPIQNATMSTYTLTEADKGKIISVDVDAGLTISGTTTWASWSTEILQKNIVKERSFISAEPTISGSLKVGSQLKAIPGVWGQGVAFSYQWHVNGQLIPNAIQDTYTVSSSDLEKTISVTVTGNLSGFPSKSRTSSATAPVAKGSLITTPATISGTVKVGNRLTVNHAPWGPAPVAITYQWYRSGVLIPGATASSYMLTADDRGKIMTVHVTGRKTGYTAVYRKSAATVAVAYGDLKGSFPTLSGTPDVNNTLIASPGLWTAGVTVSYQWYRDGVLVTGASGRYYKLTSADLGKQIKVRVLGKKTGYASRAYYSLSTTKVAPAIGDGSHMMP